jgi:hypothetical protein
VTLAGVLSFAPAQPPAKTQATRMVRKILNVNEKAFIFISSGGICLNHRKNINYDRRIIDPV